MDGWRAFQRKYHKNRDQLRRLRRTEAVYRHQALGIKNQIQAVVHSLFNKTLLVGFAFAALVGYWAGSMRCTDDVPRFFRWVNSLI